MDVRCGRCGTEYEFDNALVSERGTTVRCTSCGYQFKVFPEKPPSTQNREQWVVKKRGGAQVTYRSLKGLQKAITDGHIAPEDTFSKDGKPFRPLETVAELATFFQAKPKGKPAGTLLGIQPSAPGHAELSAAVAPPPVRPPSEPPLATFEAQWSQLEVAAPAAPQIPVAPAAVAPEAPLVPTAAVAPEAPPPARELPPLAARSVDLADADLRSEPNTERSSSIPPPIPRKRQLHQPRDSSRPPPLHRDHSAPPGPRQASTMFSEGAPPRDSRLTEVPPTSRARSRWIVGFVLLGGLGLVAATVGRSYFAQSSRPAASADPTEGRVLGFVEAGTTKFYAGDIEGAKAEFDKGTAMAPQHAGVHVWLARVEATRAERLWLLLRLLPVAEATGARRLAVQQELTARLQKLDAAVLVAGKLGIAGGASDEAELAPLQVDALRLKGDLLAARALVPKMGQGSFENGYVLAMLDLADDAVATDVAVDRLRAAASSERGLDRANAALGYALIRAKKGEAARAELTKLAADAELSHALEAYAAAQNVSLGPSTEPASAASDAPPVDAPNPGAAGAPGASDAPNALVKNPGELLQQAAASMSSGDPDRAERLYREVLRIEPGNAEASTGLGDVAVARGQVAAAGEAYDRVLRMNPGYTPALIARADLRWSSGDHPGAVRLYEQVLSRVGTSHPYGQRARRRIDQAAVEPKAAPAPSEATGSGDSAPTHAAPAAPPSAAPSPPAEPAPKAVTPEPTSPPSNPDVDMSDLPGFGK